MRAYSLRLKRGYYDGHERRDISKNRGHFILFLALAAFVSLILSGRTAAEQQTLYPSQDLTELISTGRLQFVNGYANLVTYLSGQQAHR